MEDRRTSLLAAALGCACVGGLWLAHPAHRSGSLGVDDRVVLSRGYGIDSDAALAFRVKRPAALREAEVEGLPVSYRIVDRKGRIYPVIPMVDPRAVGFFKLPRGYATRPEGARLEAFLDGSALASCPIEDLPPAEHLALVPSAHPCLRLVYQGDPGLCIVLPGGIPQGERWRVLARRTRYADGLDSATELPTRIPASVSGRLIVPYPEESGAVEVEVERYRWKPETMVVRVPNLRLLSRFGGVALAADRSAIIPNPFGADVRVPRQYMGPRHPVRHKGPRSVAASFVAIPAWVRDSTAPRFRRDPGPVVEILSPKPESLGLDELHFGPATLQAAHRVRGPVREGPIKLVARITFRRPVLVGRFRTVAPVTIAPRPWPAPVSDRGFGFGGPFGR